MSEIWYEEVLSDKPLSQGDILLGIRLYAVHPSSLLTLDEQPRVGSFVSNAIVLTQACDLENDPPVESVVLATMFPAKKESWSFVSDVNAGNRPNYHILNEYRSENVNLEYQIIDFSDLYTLPYSVLEQYRETVTMRLRLVSPYLEYTSARFGHYFSRIGLPKGIDKRKLKTFIQDQ